MRFLNKIISYAILLLVFLIPWQARWIISLGQINGGAWEYGTQSVYTTEILLAVILVLVVVSSWRPKADRIHPSFFKWILSAARQAASRMTIPAGAALLFLIYAGLSVWWAIDKNTALIHWRFLVEAGVVFLILSSGIVAKNKIHWAIILSAVIQAGWGIGQFLWQSIPASTILGLAHQGAEVLGASVVETLDGRWLRAYGSFPHPNILGGWLVLGLISIVALLTKANGKQPTGDRKETFLSAISYLLFAILLFGLLTTFSRSAWLAFAVVLLGTILLSLRAKRSNLNNARGDGQIASSAAPPRNDIWRLFTLTALTVIIFAALFPDPFLSRFSSNRLETKSNIERVGSWREGIEVIKKHPILGVGIGNYGLAVHRDIDNIKPAWYYQPVHNVFLLIWAELGIVGLLLILLIAFLLLRGTPPWRGTAAILSSRWISLSLKSTSDALSGLLRPLLRARNDMIFILPLFLIALFDHYLFSLYSGLMIGAVYLANISRK